MDIHHRRSKVGGAEAMEGRLRRGSRGMAGRGGEMDTEVEGGMIGAEEWHTGVLSTACSKGSQ